MGRPTDLSTEAPGMVINAVYWALGMKTRSPHPARRHDRRQIQAQSFGFGDYVKGRSPPTSSRLRPIQHECPNGHQ